MFKKSKRNFRTKKASSEEESDNSSAEPADLANFDKSNQKLIESIKNKKTLESKLTSTILSFEADLLNEDENDVTEFKVKKSKESRRITKELKKSKKEKERQTRIDNGEILDDEFKKSKEEVLTSEDILFNEGIKGTLKQIYFFYITYITMLNDNFNLSQTLENQSIKKVQILKE